MLCKHCGNPIEDRSERALYCSPACKKAAQNRRYYLAHAAIISKANSRRQKRKRKQPRKTE